MSQDIAAVAVSLVSVKQDVADAALAVDLHKSVPSAAPAVSSSQAVAAPTAAAPSLPAAAPFHINPVSYLDPTVGLVVLQFYNAQGVQTASIPTQKQLHSYRLHAIETGDFEPQSIPDAEP